MSYINDKLEELLKAASPKVKTRQAYVQRKVETLNLAVIREIKELARKAKLEITVDSEGEMKENSPKGLIPVVVCDISGSMVTPENKAMATAVAAGLDDRETATDGSFSVEYYGCHTSSIHFGHGAMGLDAMLANKQTGGTILSKGLTAVQSGIAGDDECQLYYLTDGDNWCEDNNTFVDILEGLYMTGKVNQAVIHIARHDERSLSFITKVEYLATMYEGIKVIHTSDRMEDVRLNAAKVLEAFDSFAQ